MRFDFTDYVTEPKMLAIIMKETGFSAERAIHFALSEKNYREMISPYGIDVAITTRDVWGLFEDNDKRSDHLENPVVDVPLSKRETFMLNDIAKRFNGPVNMEDILGLFLTLLMRQLGYAN